MRPLPPHTSPDTKGTRNGIFRFATNAAADGHPLAELRPYIDWTYFFHAWGFEPRYASIARTDSPESWLAAIPPRQQAKAAEALRLYHDAGLLLDQLAACPTARVESIYRLCTAYSDGDDLLLDGVRLPLLRQQTSRRTTEAPCLCLSDFVRPLSQGTPDVVGVFATAAHMPETDTGTADDPYRHLLVQTLADRLAEAATELAHLWIRRHAWGYAPDERLDIPALLAGKFQGIRPAVGYPSLPDQSVNFILDRLLQFGRIGISLTPSGAMSPHSSTSGLMLAHPAARYFAVGPIGTDQLEDYARRRELSPDALRRFLPNVR